MRDGVVVEDEVTEVVVEDEIVEVVDEDDADEVEKSITELSGTCGGGGGR